jgi:ABC-type transport system involved in Fe-S cluster assembly fused permease/ATPase subunit
VCIYCTFILVNKVMKEMQSVVYLRVQQTAFIEISETTFAHVHKLSLEWHLKKKMGDVLRSMDRGGTGTVLLIDNTLYSLYTALYSLYTVLYSLYTALYSLYSVLFSAR